MLGAAEVEVSGLMYARTLNLEVVLGAGSFVEGGLGGGLEGVVEVTDVDLTISIQKLKTIRDKRLRKDLRREKCYLFGIGLVGMGVLFIVG